METEKKTDPRVRRTRKWLQNALVSLMQEKPFEKIQIKEITTRADLSRPTFYMHYQSKLDLLTDYFDTIFIDYFDELKTAAAANEVARGVVPSLAFHHWKEQRESILLLKEAGLEFVFLRRLQEHMFWLVEFLVERDFLKPPKEDFRDYYHDFISGGVFLVVSRWLEEGCTHSPEVMADIVVELLGGLVIPPQQ